MIAPPADLLTQAVESNDLEPLAAWFVTQRSPGYSFQTIADFVAEERSKTSKPKAKRAPSTTRKTRFANPTTKMEMMETV